MDNVEQIKKREEKKKPILNELFETEKKYVEDLNILTEAYLKGLSDHPKIGSWGIESLVKDIVHSLQVIQETNQRLHEALKIEYENDHPKIGKIFLKFKDDWMCYIKYCSYHEVYRKELGEAKIKNKACAELLNTIRQTDNRVKLNDIDGFLIKPIQRICKYPLFFEQLLKCLDESDDEFEDTRSAYNCIQRVTELINEGTKKLQTLEKMKELNPEMKRALGKDFELFQTDRYFMREAILPKILINKPNAASKKLMSVHLVLFSDILLVGISSSKSTLSSIVGKFKYKTHVMLSSVNMLEEDDKNNNEPCFTLEETQQDKTRSITIYFGNQSTRYLWFKEISDLHIKSVRTWKVSDKNIIEDLKDEIERKKELIEELSLLEQNSRMKIEELENTLSQTNNELEQINFELKSTKDILFQTQTLSNQLSEQLNQAQLKSDNDEKELNRLKQSHNQLQQQASSSSIEIKNLKMQIDNLEEQMQSENNESNKIKKNLVRIIEGIEKKMNADKEKLVKMTEQRDSLTEDLQSVSKEYNQLKIEIEMIKKNNVSTKEMFGKETQYLMEQVQGEQKKYLEISRTLQEEIDHRKKLENLLEEQKNLNSSLNENISNLKNEMSLLDTNFQLEVKKNKELHVKFSQSLETIQSLESQLSDSSFSNESLSKSLSDVSEKYEKSKSEISSLNQRLLISEKTISKLEEEKNFLESSSQKMKSQIEKLNSTVSELNNKIDTLNKTIHSNQQKHNNKVKSLQNEINNQANNYKSLENELHNEKIRYSDLENQIREKNLIIFTNNNKMQSLQSQLEQQTSKVNLSKTKITDLEEESKKKDEKNSLLLQEIGKLNSELSKLHQDNFILPTTKTKIFSILFFFLFAVVLILK